MLHENAMLLSSNNALPERRLINEGLRATSQWLPEGWSVASERPSLRAAEPDARWAFAAPDAQRATFAIEAKQSLEPREAERLIARLQRSEASWLIVSPYLSRATRDKLAAAEISYLDLTGNVYIRSARPGLLLRAQGAERDPGRSPRAVASLRGARAAGIVRDLIERRRPGTLRAIGERTGADVGYVSRVLAFLDAQALVTRSRRGELIDVAWRELLERWSVEAPLASRGAATRYLAPRGLDEFVTRLPSAEGYAVTGSLATTQVSPIAPVRVARIYVADARGFAATMALRPVEAGANVVLIEVDDRLALTAGARPAWHGLDDAITYTSPVNVAADLLTGSGREPEEGEALLAWMQAHEEVWRA